MGLLVASLLLVARPGAPFVASISEVCGSCTGLWPSNVPRSRCHRRGRRVFQRGLLEAGGVAVAQGWWAPERSESEPVSIREREREMMEPICDGLQTYLRPCY